MLPIQRVMCRIAIASVLMGAMAADGLPAIAAAPTLDWSNVAQRVVPATVSITASRLTTAANAIGELESLSGSGFIIDLPVTSSPTSMSSPERSVSP